MAAAGAGVLLWYPAQSLAQTTTTNGTWLNSGASSANWSDTTNWVGGTVAGSVSAVNFDNGSALFNTAVGAAGTSASPILIDHAAQNIGSINFDTGAGNYSIGTTTGNPLNIYDGGTIQISSTISNQSAIETVNAPLSIVGGSTGYNLNNSTTGGVLNIGGNINQAEGAQATLNLSSTSSQINVLSGNISDGTGGGLGNGGNFVGLNLTSGIWALAGNNTYTGPTVIGANATLALESNNALFNTQSLINAVGSTIELVGNNLNVSNGTEHSLDGTHVNNLPTYVSNIVNPSGNNQLNVNIQQPSTQGLTVNCSSGFLTLNNNSPIGTGAPYTFIGAGSGLCYMSIASSQNTWNFNSTGTWNMAAGSISGQHGIQFPGSWHVNSGTVIINDFNGGAQTSTSEDEFSNGNQYNISTGATVIETPNSAIGGGTGVWNVVGGTLEFLGSNTNSVSQLGGFVNVSSGTLIIGAITSLGATTDHVQMTGGTMQGTLINVSNNLSSGQIATNLNASSTAFAMNYNFSGPVTLLFNNVMEDTGNQPLNAYSGIFNTSGPLYTSANPAYLQLHRIHIDDGSNASTVAGPAHTFTLTGPGTTIINGIIQDGIAAAPLPGTVVDNSTGSLTLQAANNYSGGTIIGAGVVFPLGSTTLGAGGSGPFSIGPVTLGNAFTTANNTSPTIELASGQTLSNPIIVANNTTTGTYTIGTLVDNNETISGSITLNQPLNITMVSSLFFSTLNVTGGINSPNGSQVNFAGPGAINVLTNPIVGTTAVNVSGGVTTFSTANNYSGGTTIAGGLLISTTGLAGVGSGLITINGGGVILNSTSASTVNGMLLTGYSGGKWNGSSGINSTAANHDSSHLHAVGMLQPANSTTFETQPLNPADVALKYTWYGDADLSGVVDGSDYSIIDSNYLNEQTTHAAVSGWYNGDFNYDGVIDGSDYTLIDNAYNSQGSAIAAQIATPTAQIAGSSAVPEPASLGLLGIGAVGLLGRSRHRRRH